MASRGYYTAGQAQELTGSIGETVDSAEEALQGTFQRAKKRAGEAIETVQDGIQHSADYLENSSLVGILEDIETIIRRYPLQTLGVGFGLGYLFSRLHDE